MSRHVFADRATLASAVAHALAGTILASTTIRADGGGEGSAYDIALTGGSVAREVHRALAARATGVPWNRVRFWFGDERFVPTDSPDRNAGQARSDVLEHLLSLSGGHALRSEGIVEIAASDQIVSVEAAATAYDEQLRAQLTRFDLVMLGVGPDGHIASLFPHHPALGVRGTGTVAVTDSPKPPPKRVSLTYEALRNTKAVWFVAAGEDKAEAVARALATEGSIADTPARGVADLAAGVTWWLDEAAAARVTADEDPPNATSQTRPTAS